MKGKLNEWNVPHADVSGVTMPELIAVIAITGVLAAIAAPSVSFGRQPLQDSTERVSSVLKLARSKAIAETSAYRVSATSSTEIEVMRSTGCNSVTWDAAPVFTSEQMTLDDGVMFSAASQGNVVPADSWSICFNSRGLTDSTLQLTVSKAAQPDSEVIQVFRGGSVNIR